MRQICMEEIRSHGNMAGLRVNWINDDWISEVQLYFKRFLVFELNNQEKIEKHCPFS